MQLRHQNEILVNTIGTGRLFYNCSCYNEVSEVPDKLLQKCPQLQKLGEDVKLSDVSKTVTINYNTYYECAVKNDAWIEWYQIQKHIYESVK